MIGWLLFIMMLTGVTVGWLVLVFSSRHYDRRAAERAVAAEQARRAAARAEYEHAAIVRGEIGLGTYGAFQPKDLWS